MAETDIMVAKKNSVFLIDGRRVRVRRGVTTARVGHAILKGREHIFEPLTVDYDTAEPEPVAPPSDPPTPAPAAFHPDAHGVGEVLAYLERADDAERARVLGLERQGKNRKTITGDHDGDA